MRRGLVLAFLGVSACGDEPPAPQPGDCQPPLGTWQNADGRVNGDILTLVVLDDGTVLAGTSFGVMTLDPLSKEWVRRVDFAAPVSSLAIDPADPRRVLAIADGVHESTDGGATWQSVYPAVGSGAIAFAPGDPSRVVAVIGGLTFASDDGGRFWDVRSTQPLPTILDLVVWAGNPDVLLARPEAAPAWRSVDGGTMWAELDGFEFHDLTAIGATFYATDTMIFRRSDDGWETWQGLPFSSQFVPYTLAIDPARPEALYVASAGLVHASDDGGQSWTEWFDYPPIGFPAAMAVGPDGTLHVAASRGSAVVELLDGGDEVHWYGGGISGTGRSLGEPVDGLLYAASSDGVFVSAHVGLTWATIASQLQIAEGSPTPTTIRTAPSDAAVLYVRYPDPEDRVTGRLARSDDAGMSWIDLGFQPLPAVVDPIDPHVVYRVVDGVLSISVDGADVWTEIDLSRGRITGAFADATDPAAILVGTEADGRVELLRVTDRGGAAIQIFDSEEDLAGALPLGRVVDVHITSGGELVAATLSGALLHGHAGSWRVAEPATGVEANLEHLTAHPTNPRALFGIAGGLVLRSDDLGTTWCRQDETLTGVEELAALGGTPQTLVASDGERVYRLPIAP